MEEIRNGLECFVLLPSSCSLSEEVILLLDDFSHLIFAHLNIFTKQEVIRQLVCLEDVTLGLAQELEIGSVPNRRFIHLRHVVNFTALDITARPEAALL